MELHEALSQIGEIRAKLARTETVVPSRALTVGGVGLLGCAGAIAQAIWIPHPVVQLQPYLWLWIGIATLAGGIVAVELALRYFRTESAIARRATLQALEQFAPCLVAGGCVTWAIARFASDSAALLPGLWAIAFGLGVFAALRQLPAATVLAAVYFLASGTAALVWAREGNALSPWAMAGTFGVGHFLMAAAFHFGSERQHGTH